MIAKKVAIQIQIHINFRAHATHHFRFPSLCESATNSKYYLVRLTLSAAVSIWVVFGCFKWHRPLTFNGGRNQWWFWSLIVVLICQQSAFQRCRWDSSRNIIKSICCMRQNCQINIASDAMPIITRDVKKIEVFFGNFFGSVSVNRIRSERRNDEQHAFDSFLQRQTICV